MKTKTIIRDLAIAKLILLLMWPVMCGAAVVAAPVTQDPFANISLFQVLIMFGIAVLSGATSLVLRLDREMKRCKEESSDISLFMISHMFGSILAGVLMFAVAQHNSFTVWWELATIIVASFSGARFLEKAAAFYSKSALSHK